jgi:putative GTP pyrophosphokinase
MAATDFEVEKEKFRKFYEDQFKVLQSSIDLFKSLIQSLLQSGNIGISRIEGRVKDKDECIKKFYRKYLKELEKNDTPYEITPFITDLLGLRVVCLHEDDVNKIQELMTKNFEIIEITNKIERIESTESNFGYKGLHMDLKLNETRNSLPEYVNYKNLRFELQIRTIIQDSWSVLDHKIKYKQSIPTQLKRRINTLAALFELADREFLAIREETKKAIESARLPTSAEINHTAPSETELDTSLGENSPQRSRGTPLDAFSFLVIARHFFQDFEFEGNKVDGITAEIVETSPGISKGKFNYYMKSAISQVKNYKKFFENSDTSNKLNPYTQIRHALYLSDKTLFKDILSSKSRINFDEWLNTQPSTTPKQVPTDSSKVDTQRSQALPA